MARDRDARGKAVFKGQHVAAAGQSQLACQDAGIAQLAAGIAAPVAVQYHMAAVMALLDADPLGRDGADVERRCLDPDGRRHQLGKQFLSGALAFQVLGFGGAAAGDRVHRLDGPHHGAERIIVLSPLGDELTESRSQAGRRVALLFFCHGRFLSSGYGETLSGGPGHSRARIRTQMLRRMGGWAAGKQHRR